MTHCLTDCRRGPRNRRLHLRTARNIVNGAKSIWSCSAATQKGCKSKSKTLGMKRFRETSVRTRRGATATRTTAVHFPQANTCSLRVPHNAWSPTAHAHYFYVFAPLKSIQKP